jgi:hypothetical protein
MEVKENSVLYLCNKYTEMQIKSYILTNTSRESYAELQAPCTMHRNLTPLLTVGLAFGSKERKINSCK